VVVSNLPFTFILYGHMYPLQPPGVTHKRRCTYRPSVIYLIVNKILSLSLSLKFFPWNGRSPVCHPTGKVPFPPRRSGEYRKGMIPARPLYQGVWGSVWDPEPSKERVCDSGGPATVWSLLCC